MLKSLVLVVLGAASMATCQVDSKRPQFMSRATLEINGNMVAVHADSPRPLQQAMEVLRQEYGWTVDFEDPPYESSYDLADDTDPRWRDEHPGAKGVTRISGGSFKAEIDIGGDPSSREERMLTNLVQAYNSSGNPGQFLVKKETLGNRYAIVGVAVKDKNGIEKQVLPVLETPITLREEKRTADETLRLILGEVSGKSGFTVDFGSVPLSLLLNVDVIVGGTDVPARDLIAKTLAATKRELVWRCLYDADVRTYFVNIGPVH